MTTPKLPPYVPPTSGLGRASASQLNNRSTTTTERVLSVAGFGMRVPVIWGEDRVGGVYLAGPIVDTNGGLCMALAWSIGEPYGIEGVQSLMIDGAVATHQGSGNTQLYIQHYDGTQTTVDPMLAARFTGFADKFEGIAYSAIRVPSRATGGIPTIEALVRGRKILDPRTATVAWSRNPGLVINDIVTNANWGFGRPIRGVNAVADRCDTLVSGSARCQLNLTLVSADTEEGILGLISTYAECLYEFDGDGVLVVPDAPVDAPAMSLTLSEIQQGTLRMSGLSLETAPTAVTVEYIVPSGGTAAWPSDTETARLPGVAEGLVEELSSDVSLPGIRRAAEASRKAWLRLNRLQIPGEIAWQMFDNGIIPEKGDVIAMPDARGMTSIWVRVMSKQMLKGDGNRLAYQFTAEIYSSSVYDDHDEPTGVLLPVGAIVPLYTGDIPAGWERWTAGDGKWLRGAATAGTTGGTATATVSGDSSENGAHTGTTAALGMVPDAAGSQYSDLGSTNAGGHKHGVSFTVNIGTNQAPVSRRMRMIKKTGSADQLPPNAGFLALGPLLSTLVSEVNDYNGRLLVSDATPASFGITYPIMTSITSSSHPGHIHGLLTRTSLPAGASIIHINRESPPHQHSGNLPINLRPKSRNVALYVATASTDVIPGAVIGWEGGDPPAGWRICTELHDEFIRFTSAAEAGVESGDNSLTLSGNLNTAGEHNHPVFLAFGSGVRAIFHEDMQPAHLHSVNLQAPAVLPFHTLIFLEYTGAS